jgi:3-oxoacyl-[acyl-carrier protein] reductase
MTNMDTSGSLKGKALVVGASGGIGKAVALALAQQGVECVLMGRTEKALEAVAKNCREAGTAASVVLCDIARISTIEAAVAETISTLGGLNYLINCAGISPSGKLHEIDVADSDLIIDTNLRAHYHLVRSAITEINKTPGGAVIKIGAVNHPYSGVNTYLAANRGAEGYAEALFEDVREFGTRVCTIKPGWVNTPLVQSEEGIDTSLMIQPEDIAKTVLYMLLLPQTVCPTEITLLPLKSPYI